MIEIRLPKRGLAVACAASAIGALAVAVSGEPGVAATAAVRPVAHVDGGTVRGVSSGVGADAVTTYLGIPYAAPPTGDRRWRDPRPVVAWHGTRDASQFAPSCPQPLAGNAFLPPGPISEDCLHVNVYAPTHQHRNGASHPVLVWIHGGGLTEDGARNYDGSKLAADGVVVVTVDYRLGALGFLADPALAGRPGAPTGNFGYMDQQAALRWVQRNITSFGGDRNEVTIAGQSAGGLSVLANLVSPGSRGLFQRAIVQSGAFALHQHSLAYAEVAGQQFANSIGCAQNTAACLRQAPLTDLVNPSVIEIPGYVDGSVLRQPIATALAEGRFAHVPILNGITHDEERLFVDGLMIAVSGGTDVPVPDEPITDVNYQTNIAAVLGVSNADAATIAAEYPPAAYPSADVAFSTLVSDANFACPAQQVDEWTSGRVPTFAYQFNDDKAPVVIAPPGHFPQVATHDSELPYLFDQPNTPYPPTLDSDQQNLASNMRAAWSHFAARGRPSTSALAWPGYADGGTVMSLATPQSAPETSFAAIHKCAFWNAG